MTLSVVTAEFVHALVAKMVSSPIPHATRQRWLRFIDMFTENPPKDTNGLRRPRESSRR
jgi:hypothetical protein